MISDFATSVGGPLACTGAVAAPTITWSIAAEEGWPEQVCALTLN